MIIRKATPLQKALMLKVKIIAVPPFYPIFIVRLGAWRSHLINMKMGD